MSDTTLNAFVASGTAAEMAAFTPTPPVPAAGPDPGYFWFQTDTGLAYSWDGAAWAALGSPTAITSLTGDVTATGPGAAAATIANLAVSTAKIAADAVTYAKIQNVSATSRVLGRKTAGAGDTEELTMSEVLDFVGSAAQGDILYRNAAGWVRLAAGTSGFFLQTLGAAANPQWAQGATFDLTPNFLLGGM